MLSEFSHKPLRVLRVREVVAKSGHSRSMLYLHIAQGLWPRPIRLSSRSVGWPEHEADAVLAARIAGKRDDEIRQLVVDLQIARQGKA